jgi:hypothetical protein
MCVSMHPDFTGRRLTPRVGFEPVRWSDNLGKCLVFAARLENRFQLLMTLRARHALNTLPGQVRSLVHLGTSRA